MQNKKKTEVNVSGVEMENGLFFFTPPKSVTDIHRCLLRDYEYGKS